MVAKTAFSDEALTLAMPLSLERQLILCTCLFVTCFTLLFSQAAITDNADGRSMFEVTKSFVENRSFAIDPRYGFPGRDGQFYASHGLGMPLLAIVPYLVVRPLARTLSLGEHVTEASVASLIPLVTGLLVVALYGLARRLGVAVRTAVMVAVGAVAGTHLLAYTKEFFSEPLATLFLVIAIERAVALRPLASGIAAAAAALTRPQFFMFAPILAWRLWRDGGWSALLRSAAPWSIALVLTLGYNSVRFGDPMHFGYAGLGFTTPFLQGARGLLFHPEKSIFLFAPIVILIPFGLRQVWGINRTAFWLLSGNLVLTFCTMAKWVDWYGGWVWGPRPLIPAVVPAIVAIAPWIDLLGARRVLGSALFFVGFLISAPTLIVSQRAQLIHRPPQYGPNVIRQFMLVPETVRFTREHLLDAGDRQQRYERYVNTWQVSLIRLAGLRGILFASVLSLTLATVALVCAHRALRTIRETRLRDG
jgi:hypothetical protein